MDTYYNLRGFSQIERHPLFSGIADSFGGPAGRLCLDGGREFDFRLVLSLSLLTIIFTLFIVDFTIFVFFLILTVTPTPMKIKQP